MGWIFQNAKSQELLAYLHDHTFVQQCAGKLVWPSANISTNHSKGQLRTLLWLVEVFVEGLLGESTLVCKLEVLGFRVGDFSKCKFIE